jgi:hypothetical protein
VEEAGRAALLLDRSLFSPPQSTDGRKFPGQVWCVAFYLIPMEKAVTALLRGASKRGLDCLLIGGNAVILLGYIRNTVDLDLLLPEEARSDWLDLMRELGYRFLHGVTAFAQFEPPDESAAPVDLMFVEQATWEKLSAGAKEMDLAGERVLVPQPEYLVALKLHAAASPTRGKPEVDWEDIRQIVRLGGLRADEEPFRSLILRYGGEDALRRIQEFRG